MAYGLFFISHGLISKYRCLIFFALHSTCVIWKSALLCFFEQMQLILLLGKELIQKKFQLAFIAFGQLGEFFKDILLVRSKACAGVVMGGICAACNIVQTDIVEVRQQHGKIQRYGMLALFVVGIGGLMHVQLFAQLLLCQVAVLSQIPDTLVMLHK